MRSLCTAARVAPTHRNYSLHTATKTQHSQRQIDKYVNKYDQTTKTRICTVTYKVQITRFFPCTPAASFHRHCYRTFLFSLCIKCGKTTLCQCVETASFFLSCTISYPQAIPSPCPLLLVTDHISLCRPLGSLTACHFPGLSPGLGTGGGSNGLGC